MNDAPKVADAGEVTLRLKSIAPCEICGGEGAVDSGGSEPWGAGIPIKCGHCDGSGKEPPPEEMCQLFEMCELQKVHPELKAAVGALILRCMDAEIKLRRLPADWFTDSSLETWFPLTAEELTRTKAENRQLEEQVHKLSAAQDPLLKDSVTLGTITYDPKAGTATYESRTQEPAQTEGK